MFAAALIATLLAPVAVAEGPCGTIDDPVVALLDIADGIGSTLSAARDTKIPERVADRTLKMLETVKVHEMAYCDAFDCDDFAFAFDEVCGEQGIPCWQLDMGASGFWVWSPGMGHVLNIVQVDLPKDSKGRVRYVAVEPQNNSIVSMWYQPRGSKPVFPEEKYVDLEKVYPSFDLWYQRVSVYESGHNPNAGEQSFTRSEKWKRAFKLMTGHSPENYDETPKR